MDYPEVDVKLLDVGEALEAMSGDGMVGLLIEKSIETQQKQYRLSWKGNKVPRGAIVNSREIAWTQHGMVRDSCGTVIGYYERLVEWGGDDKQDQVMLIAMLPSKQVGSERP